jgi:hypothetical protein
MLHEHPKKTTINVQCTMGEEVIEKLPSKP